VFLERQGKKLMSKKNPVFRLLENVVVVRVMGKSNKGV
jgi:hypothetical protein